MDILWCQKRHTLVSKNAGQLEKEFNRRKSAKTSKDCNETHKKHQKIEIKGKEVNSMDIPWLLETWMEQEKSSTQQKSAKNNNSSSNSPKKEIFRQKNSQKSDLNGQKHINTP